MIIHYVSHQEVLVSPVRHQVDMPVFFYIDPELTEDPAMAKVDTITPSYTIFEAKEAELRSLVYEGFQMSIVSCSGFENYSGCIKRFLSLEPKN